MYYVVLVTGSRDPNHPSEKVRVALNLAHRGAKTLGLKMLLIHGDAPGVDTIADRWAERQGVQRVKVPANWNGEGKRGGPIRNQLMLDFARPRIDMVLAFPGPESKGTWDMVSRVWRTHTLLAYDTNGRTINAESIEANLERLGLL